MWTDPAVAVAVPTARAAACIAREGAHSHLYSLEGALHNCPVAGPSPTGLEGAARPIHPAIVKH